MFTRPRSLYRCIAFVLLFCFLFQIVAPTTVLALTSGPSQPEFSGFESVSTSEMVNPFTGDFTYNLPLLTVPGPQGSSYPLTLAYHSGVSSEEEASWVGYGWSLTPGSINRNMRGIPDDDKGNKVKYWNKMPINWTVSAGGGASGEVFSKELPVSADVGIRYNNYNGFGYNTYVGMSTKLFNGATNVSLGLSGSESGRSFSVGVSPYKSLAGSLNLSLNESPDGLTFGASYNPYTFLNYISAEKGEFKKDAAAKGHLGSSGAVLSLSGNHGLFSFSEMVRPLSVTPYTGFSTDVNVGLEGNIAIPAGAELRISGSLSVQRNDRNRTSRSYGYMYASSADGAPNTNQDGLVSDYYTEKETSYIRRDKFLGMAFNNADNFVVNGEGVGGGFRLYHKNIGQFYPTFSESRTAFTNGGVDLHVGNPFGVGGTGEAGTQTLTESEWDKGISSFTTPAGATNDSNDEDIFFRFNNDQGGVLNYSMSVDLPVQATISRNRNPILPTTPNAVPNFLTERNRRASFIGYNTNASMFSAGKFTARAYSRRIDINNQANRTNTSNADRIGEFSVYNTSGMQYTYALPVYSRNERHLQFGVGGLFPESNYLIYGDKIDKDSNPVKLGEERLNSGSDPYESAYATTYLLTQITTPDFTDINLDGPDATDPGGYTLFHYTKLYGENNDKNNNTNEWYKWRLPYTGMLYQRGTLSDPIDDRGALSDGEKEIYLVKKIETKTHVAVFRTSARQDGLDAPAKDAAMQKDTKGGHTLEKLDRIDLYTISEYTKNGDNARPIKSVFFTYDYSLCQGVKNSSSNGGKLTLKKVWFEYYGVRNTGGKISPYVFEYSYPDFANANPYPAMYQSLGTNYQFTAAQQNPTFSYFLQDAWGNYQANGLTRFTNMQPWVNQQSQTGFDPAAWHLKVITLPSGGEIHVQYEQDDYAYVQDQPAHVMRSIDSVTGRRYFLQREGETDSELQTMAQAIRDQYGNKKNKLYFKFLYRLLGTSSTPQIGDCNAEYISGYVDIMDVGVQNGKVYIDLGSTQNGTQHELPNQVCVDFVQSQRVGKLTTGVSCVGISSFTNPVMEDATDLGKATENAAVGIVKKLVNMARINLGGSLCATMNTSLSYLKVPAAKDKKGGGVRVKRLLTFDKGVDGEKVLYGSEFIYKAPDPNRNNQLRSSGVAANEPSTIREENALVGFMPRFKQNFLSKAVAGIDKKQAEGPLGESLLPGPSVGYSRIIIRNIHSGKTNPGFAVKEFYTANQKVEQRAGQLTGNSTTNSTYAFWSDMTGIEAATQKLSLPLLLVNKYINSAWLTQGFSFYINDMHGKPKRDATYAGVYSENETDDLVKAVLVTEQKYDYFAPGEAVPVVDETTGKITLAKLGTEVDVTYGQKKVSEKKTQAGAVGDFTTLVVGIFPFPFPIVLPTTTAIQNETYVHTTTKIVRQTCMLRKQRTYADGIYHTDEYLAFDPNTGQPVWSKSYDEFAAIPGTTPSSSSPPAGAVVLASEKTQGGAYASHTQMAAWHYPGMRAKYLSENRKMAVSSVSYQNLGSGQGEYLNFAGSDMGAICTQLQQFVPGDLIEISPNVYYNTDAPDYFNRRIRIYPSSKLTTGTLPADGTISQITIVHTGRSNELTIPAGSTTYHNPDASWDLIRDTNGFITYRTRATNASGNANPYPFSIPVSANTSSLTGVGTFADDLSARYQTIESSSSGVFAVNQHPSYANMNISAYAAKIPAGCQINPESAEISNINFRFKKVGDKISLQLISFMITCGETKITIQN
ncbi:hypothetical protein [Xanthocytophaga agilis]|uniref:Uncharacterized protein n=1 Tax=Xanthocytophaga agilis TaxID=3048010 RepID=A0AAE3UG27_9BACT|nr:hypothetical protein [Xanthocytophaga agilis]MDJ1501198.1 hypothetical protein [Xanthocytophaga agilis]